MALAGLDDHDQHPHHYELTVGVIIEDLEDHEGYGARRLRDGTLTSTWSAETTSVETYLPCCICGWQGTSFAASQDGYEEACRAWENDHAIPLLRLTPPHRVTATIDTARRAVAGLAQERPLAALRVLREINRWTDSLAGRAAVVAREHRESIQEVAEATGIGTDRRRSRQQARNSPRPPQTGLGL